MKSQRGLNTKSENKMRNFLKLPEIKWWCTNSIVFGDEVKIFEIGSVPWFVFLIVIVPQCGWGRGRGEGLT